jgi:hypothetical protein
MKCENFDLDLLHRAMVIYCAGSVLDPDPMFIQNKG